MSLIRNIVNTVRFGGGSYRCNVCDRSVRTFFRFASNLTNEAARHGFPYDFRRMETLNFDQCNCPFCLASDRERLYMLFLSGYFERHPGQYRILDFAPNPVFTKRMRKFRFVSYTSADIDRIDVDMKLDICNMDSLRDEEFDIVICSHVLEHVSSPTSALSEIHRVMKPGGLAIIMVPLFYDVTETIEDLNTRDEAERWRRFGQGDHVRLFSRQDFVQRLVNTPFRVEQYTYQDFDQPIARAIALAENTVLYTCIK